MSQTAESTYRRLVQEARPHLERGETSHASVKLLRLVDECLDKIIPHQPFAPNRALSGKLSNIFRVRKGRIRVCYIASSVRSEIVILYISETLRKEGDRNDPYRVFSSMLMSGRFDQLFAMPGVKRPTC